VRGIFHLEAKRATRGNLVAELPGTRFTVGGSHEHRDAGLFARGKGIRRDAGHETPVHDRFYGQVELAEKRGAEGDVITAHAAEIGGLGPGGEAEVTGKAAGRGFYTYR
jgi:hypothetical protein